MLDELIPAPRLLERNHVDLAATPEQVWSLLRHGDLAHAPLIHALFWLRALPGRLRGKHEPAGLRLDNLTSTPERPGFQVLGETPGQELVVGAIGKVWQGDIPFVHVGDAAEYARFQQPDFVKVAWSLSV